MQKKAGNSSNQMRLILMVLIAIVMFAGLSWINYRFLTGPHRYDDRDFVSLWAGGKAVIAGLNPYDPDVWGPWRISLGNTWVPDSREPFPLWTLLFFLPFSILDLGWGAATWVAFSLYMLVGASFFLGKIFNHLRLSLIEFFLLALGAALYRGGVLTLFVGQLTFELLFILALFMFLVYRKRPFAAGLVLACVAFKPNPFILFVPLFGVWLLSRREWQIILGAITGAATLFLISWITIPGWLFQWFNVTGKTEVTQITPTIWGLAYELTPNWWAVTGLLLLIIITIVLGWLLVFNKNLTLYEATSLALGASILTTPYAWEYEHLLLLIPWMFIFYTLRQKSRWFASAIWVTCIMVLPWLMFDVAMQRASATFTAVIPLLTLLTTYLTIWYSKRRSALLQAS
ncbi:MAG: DUF2029 domain-containing protein [Chloroflexi bacterium]|nr:MAG: DUF2029 domain-containing protein [Chloroflexota bacterium]